MDLRGVRTLNLIGTFLLALIGIFTPLFYGVATGFLFFMIPNAAFAGICLIVILAWMIVVIVIVYNVSNNTVLGINRGEY